MQDLKGKIVWITGAGSGIGEAAAHALARQGCFTILTGRRTEPLKTVAADIQGLGGKAFVKAADVSDADAVRDVAGWMKGEFGKIDILVNNAGTNIKARSWASVSIDGIDQVLKTNLLAGFYCVAEVLPTMRAQKDGLLIHTSSWAGKYNNIVTGPSYAAAKAGLVSMSEFINMEECVNGIRSCVICPGEVATPILDNRPAGLGQTAQELEQMLGSE